MLTDRRAMTAIAAVLDETEDWSADTLDEVVLMILATGRSVAGQEPTRRRRAGWTTRASWLLVAVGIAGNVAQWIVEVIG